MPVYEYKCEKGHTFETIESMKDDPLTKCEECGAPAQRILFAPAVHFKGKGFYNTDYGTKNRQREMKAADSKSKSEKASASSDSSDKSTADKKGGSEKGAGDKGGSASKGKSDSASGGKKSGSAKD
ncbi:MAG: zinc ribbon domain-containing protein [Solirubrobacterales bacterium]|nr:zinc ribbon domain-containing protein [Solirubrobacterales bacterium]